jgi:hypothetical protein
MNELIRFMFNHGWFAVIFVGAVFSAVAFIVSGFLVTLLHPKECSLDPEDLQR